MKNALEKDESSLIGNRTLIPIEQALHKHVITFRYLLKITKDVGPKAWIVCKGYRQIPGVQFNEDNCLCRQPWYASNISGSWQNLIFTATKWMPSHPFWTETSWKLSTWNWEMDLRILRSQIRSASFSRLSMDWNKLPDSGMLKSAPFIIVNWRWKFFHTSHAYVINVLVEPWFY